MNTIVTLLFGEMFFKVRTVVFLALFGLIYCIPPKHKQQENDTLVLVHVLFRHGNRTAELSELYPKDPYLNYTYYPFGNGQLTNEGKRKEYSIGETLRARYGEFLGPSFYPTIYDAWSTDYNRTKASLQLVLGSLFPPNHAETWNQALNWQPVPYNYLPRYRDPALLGTNCPLYKLKYDKIKYSHFQNVYDENKNTFDYISNNTGLNVTSFEEVYDLFFGLSTEEEWGFKLPAWTEPIWPTEITNLAAQQYYVYTATPELNAVANGYLVKKIIKDTQLKIENISNEWGRKIYLYSAHESNVGPLLVYLGVYDELHIPTYGSYITFEVHNLDGIYGFKIFYENYVTDQPVLLDLPNCGQFCPLDKFIQLYSDLIPEDDQCGI